ncbi:hypothetical protein [Sanguibacter suaedae]|uniref:Uncharacterized protein n=1 Tax=Sanguibacter suaedae TaxID=2795737 RepID=A0A934MAX5_9MICO|nr:hypothetical protein [Sanguibacter suaedae]MBI9116080.1 hypothetical protein [Sanguibacter suaedae]
MLHKIVTAGLVVLGLVVASLGVASGTVWRPGSTVTMTTPGTGDATMLMTAPGVLGLVDDSVTVRATAEGGAKVVLALGSEADVKGWVGTDPVLVATGPADWESLAVTTSEPATTPAPDSTPEEGEEPGEEGGAGESEAPEGEVEGDAPADDESTAETPEESAEAEPVVGPDPAGSDMWVAEAVGEGTASLEWDAGSSDQVLLAAVAGEGAGAPRLELTWPREVTTPWMWPGIVLGAVLVLVGLVVGVVGARSARPGSRRGKAVVAPGRSRAETAAPSSTSTAVPRGDEALVRRDAPRGPVGVVSTPTPAGGTEGLTRRELRERAEREQQQGRGPVARGEDGEKRPKRSWPWTGAMPTVKKADTAAQPVVPPPAEASRPAWLPEGTTSASGSSWREAWGVRHTEDGPEDRPAPGGQWPGGRTTDDREEDR